jgi:DNA polymerase-3 subunit epsilon
MAWPLPWWPARTAVDEGRWVVVDVETSGLDPARDRLLAIAAIAVRVDWAARRIAIDPGDSFEVVLRQEQVSDKANILLHGIGAQRQVQGMAPSEAMAAFRAFIGRSPLLAFHAAFDQQLVQRYFEREAQGPPANPWLDIEQLCAVTHEGLRCRALDDWLTHFGITCAVRHQAAADTFAECELLLRIWPRVAAECRSWRDVEKMAARHRWVARR